MTIAIIYQPEVERRDGRNAQSSAAPQATSDHAHRDDGRDGQSPCAKCRHHSRRARGARSLPPESRAQPSSTVMLVLGCALAMALLEARGFKPDDFARLHPGGSLGRALLTKVTEYGAVRRTLPLVSPAATVMDAGVTRRWRDPAPAASSWRKPAASWMESLLRENLARAYERHP